MNLFVNWKTTSAGITAIAGGVTALGLLYKSHNWSVEGVTAAITSLVTGIGLLFARDVNVTSADLGLQEVQKKADAKEVITPAKD